MLGRAESRWRRGERLCHNIRVLHPRAAELPDAKDPPLGPRAEPADDDVPRAEHHVRLALD